MGRDLVQLLLLLLLLLMMMMIIAGVNAAPPAAATAIAFPAAANAAAPADVQRSKSRSVSCPASMAVRVRNAEIGSAILTSKITDDVAAQCNPSSNTCNFDITTLTENVAGQILRVEWLCECGAGDWGD
jgi:hypothetical protein